LRGIVAGGLFKAEAIGPGHDRAEEQLVIGKDDHGHGPDRPANGAEILLLDRQRQ
jgi:hypothetical protein